MHLVQVVRETNATNATWFFEKALFGSGSQCN